ncbi:hypothetical protein GF336_05605 [Candidatus Woesearchaeota archaeon]|nr:hypothetical protein [Candidatus Woesearchaeota archaeon]
MPTAGASEFLYILILNCCLSHALISLKNRSVNESYISFGCFQKSMAYFYVCPECGEWYFPDQDRICPKCKVRLIPTCPYCGETEKNCSCKKEKRRIDKS